MLVRIDKSYQSFLPAGKADIMGRKVLDVMGKHVTESDNLLWRPGGSWVEVEEREQQEVEFER